MYKYIKMETVILKEDKTISYNKDKVREYNKTHYEKHGKERTNCPICFGSYLYYNKHHHMTSKKHMLAVHVREYIKNEGIVGHTSETTAAEP